MTQYFVGPGGNDANSGLSYALRKLTLNGCEDLPLVAGDSVVAAPGVYRELLTCDVSGSSGSPVSYIADVSGRLTDGIGGPVRLTGSDDDITATRANCITATSINYRTFRGFSFAMTTSRLITLITACSNWIIEDCYFAGIAANVYSIDIAGTGTNNTIRRCIFMGGRAGCIRFTHSATVNAAGHLVENNLFLAAINHGMATARVGGITMKHNTAFGTQTLMNIEAALAVGQTTTVLNNIICYCTTGLGAVTAPGTNEEITEDYNSFWGNTTDRTNVSTGTHSNAYPPLFNPLLLLAGFRLPNTSPFALAPWSPLRAIAGSGMSVDDVYGIVRPATDSKKSWGAVQFVPRSRDTATVHTGTAALKLADAGRQEFPVLTSGATVTFEVWVRWEANYAGTKPQMIIRQDGQADVTVTATGSSGAWELLSTSITPAANPGYVQVLFVSSNTATSGSFGVYFDDFRRIP